ncbi:MAG: hypothetical protein K2G88_09700 [Oscillospiraceae bacterium]|nr:hypothetical protein [Oscillospiraceae bacterium]
MACFVVPVAEAIVTSVATRILELKENKSETITPDNVRFSVKLKWLSKLLWGGSFLLTFEHIWHGEIKPFFPFLTAAKSPESFTAMLNEVSTVGVGMALTVTTAWIGMLIISGIAEKQHEKISEVE